MIWMWLYWVDWALLWKGMSPCMSPGVGDCVVWWDAWAAIGTTAGVLVALLAPMLRRWRNGERINAILAMQFADEIAIASSSLALIERDYPLAAAERGLETLRALNVDGAKREAFGRRVGRLQTLGDAAFPFGELPPETDLKISVLIASAIHTSKALVKVIKAISEDPGGRSEVELKSMHKVYAWDYGNAKDALDAAIVEIQKTLAYLPKEWGRKG